MSKRSKRLFTRLFLVVLVLLLIGSSFAYHVYKGRALDIKNETFIVITDQDSIESLSFILQKKGGLKHPYFFKLIANRMNLNRWMKNGRYTIQKDMNLKELIQVFRDGKMRTVDLVIRPLSGLEKFAGKCGTKLEPDSADYMQVFADSAFIEELGFNRETIYAMLLPDTYNVYWHTNGYELLRKLKDEYNKYWNNERLALADSCGLTPLQVSILASIVAKETNKNDEMPMVAGMYLNRLRIDMKLQADPTVKFALNEPGLRRIYNGHLAFESPYNTYLNKGLPPGPICIPSKQSIEAVLHYTSHTYLFMCAKEDFSGYHNFAKTYSEHLAFAKLYKKALDARGIK